MGKNSCLQFDNCSFFVSYESDIFVFFPCYFPRFVLELRYQVVKSGMKWRKVVGKWRGRYNR